MPTPRQLIISLLFFFAGVTLVFGIRIAKARLTQPPTFTPTQSSFILEPPSQSQTATIVKSVGFIEKQPRDKDEYVRTSEGETILQGELLHTPAGTSATLLLPDVAQITLGSDTRLAAASLIPERLLFQQAQGTVIYEILGERPVAVRALTSLIQLQRGASQIALQGDSLDLEVFAGTAQVALIDPENQTTVQNLGEGQRATINAVVGTIEVTSL